MTTAPQGDRKGRPYILSAEFLNTLVAELDNDAVQAIILGGSYARGNATPYSDVDFARFVKELPGRAQKRYIYREGRLISIVTRTISMYREWLKLPERAIWIVPGMREARILLDKEGAFNTFQQEVIAFNWEPLQVAANYFASDIMMLNVEFVHKVLAGLLQHDEMSISQATFKLFTSLTDAIAVQRGMLVVDGNRYYEHVQTTVGQDSTWTHYHRHIAGIDTTPAHVISVEIRAIAALRLYQESAKLLRPILHSTHREVIEHSLQVIDEAKLGNAI